MNISFTVYGTPQPQGSARAFTPKGWRRAVITSDNAKLKPWRQDVAGEAIAEMARQLEGATREPIRISVLFYFAKPKSTPKKVVHKTTKPDLDKLLRGILDSLTGIVFADDAQVVAVSCTKQFGTPERAEIWVGDFSAEQRLPDVKEVA